MCSYDHPQAQVITRPTARLPHDCYVCDEMIVRGEQYVQCSGVWEGGGATFRFHELCWTLEQSLMRDDMCGGAVFGSLHEAVHERQEPALAQALRTVFWRHVMEGEG